MRYHIGERVLVSAGSNNWLLQVPAPPSNHDREVRGWLESVDDFAVVVRLPSEQNPEAPGEMLMTIVCPTSPVESWSATCTSIHDHHGVSIGYLDPTWSRTEETARAFVRMVYGMHLTPTAPEQIEQQIEQQVRLDLRVREISLAVPLQKARIWNDHGRASMREQARLSLMTGEST